MRISPELSLDSLGSFLYMAFLLMLTLASGVGAFDGNRKGFVAGFGLGSAPTVNWSTSFADIEETGQGMVVDFVIGYGFNHRNVIVGKVMGVSATSDAVIDDWAFQGFNGVQWYHFLNDQKRSLYVSAGGGVMRFVSDRFDGSEWGPGFNGEIGYEFQRHFQISAYGIFGRTKRGGISSTHKQFGILLRILAY